MSDMTKSEGLLAAIGQRGAILYGAGYVAETLHAALVRHGTWDRVVACFTTTEPDSPLWVSPNWIEKTYPALLPSPTAI